MSQADELLREARERLAEYTNSVGLPDTDNMELIDRIDAYLASGGWIDCKDRLPEINDGYTHKEPVLVKCEDGTVFPAQFHMNGCFYPDRAFKQYQIANLKGVISGAFLAPMICAKAIGWQPLPSLPKDAK